MGTGIGTQSSLKACSSRSKPIACISRQECQRCNGAAVSKPEADLCLRLPHLPHPQLDQRVGIVGLDLAAAQIASVIYTAQECRGRQEGWRLEHFGKEFHGLRLVAKGQLLERLLRQVVRVLLLAAAPST